MDAREKAAIKPCVGCGYCCKEARCAVSFAAESAANRPMFKFNGKIPRTEPECPFLYWNKDKFRCFLAKHKLWKTMLDFGEGCCCSLNTERLKYGPSQAKKAKKP